MKDNILMYKTVHIYKNQSLIFQCHVQKKQTEAAKYQLTRQCHITVWKSGWKW
jgi:hypothetical protein